MFVTELFEAKIQKTLVILPGGFHPFHPGHLSLYTAAQQAFPGADIFYASTNDKSQRPFEFSDKEKLATIAGVPKGHFLQVKSPFQAREIVNNYDPESTVLIFARSEKDRNEPPQAGGVKKDGSPSYLQPYTRDAGPLNKHGYMAYLPVVQFKSGTSGITSATQIREQWPRADEATKNQIVQDLYPADPEQAKAILDKYLGNISEERGSRRGIDTKSASLIRRARIAHPLAKSDEEALALYILDQEQDDYRRLKRITDVEDSMIRNLLDLERGLESKITVLQSEIDDMKRKIKTVKEASGYIPRTDREARDPRWSHALTHDVHPDTMKKEIAAFFPTQAPKGRQIKVTR